MDPGVQNVARSKQLFIELVVPLFTTVYLY
jgi:hypothetical protein